ncbi:MULTISPECIES: two-component regulator propeller domain-containing protein [unclassified Algibacter]|uniref:hybrid sensor histidine kinase/response regulator transcription factor n=1 Tax=unclassified Algibacter TaxID=2615009 RepID=UPI00131AED98|nr:MULTISPECIES: two-component regulator propeller domain-containing protein [unclassified Algibacter]MCL5128365.1 response regulator [Algibacter sp. L4_22]
MHGQKEIKTDLTIPKQFAFSTLSIRDGLSQNSVISIAQDSIGYLWFATQDGLNKYDGRHFIHYEKQFEDITRNTFSKLGKVYIDKQNKLWIITHSGKLELYQNKTDNFKHIKLPHAASSIFQDKNLNMYIGLYDNGLLKIDAETNDTIQILKHDDRFRTIYDYIEIENDLIVAAANNIYKINSNNSYEKINESSNTSFSVLEKTTNGDAWLGTYGKGLFFKPLNSNEFKKYNNTNLPENLNIEDLLVDKKGRLWIATYGNGVYLINNKTNKVTNFKANKNNPFAIHYNDILSLYEDKTGIIWFGSDGTGASYYDEHLIKFNILTNNQVPKSVNVDMVRSITTDVNENLWIGTSGKGLTYFDIRAETYRTFTSDNSKLSSNRIVSLNSNYNELWIGHQAHGLNTMDASGNLKSYSELENFTIWQIINESPTQKWLCTELHGIILFDKNKGIIKEYNRENSALTSNNIKTLVKSDNGIIWIGTDNNGVFKLNTTTNKITKLNGIDQKIKSLYAYNNFLWIGTNGAGLKEYDITKNTTKTYTEKDGLPNDVVYGILPDNKGKLWLSTNNGLSCFNASENAKSFENFSVFDGLQSSEFNTGAYFKDKKGNLFFGGLEGINWFHPENLTYNTIKPKTIISKFEVFSKVRPLIKNSKLQDHENTVTFTFSSLHFSQPARNLFKYQLINHDVDWIESGNNNIAHYTNLPPNTYTFKVISCSYDRVWNETPATYTFTIKQPWYLSTLAICIYIFLFALLSYAIYYYLKWRWYMKMKLKFEHEETKRLKKLNEFKTRLYTNLSHEFRTPLTLISGPIENQLSNPKLSNKDKKELTLVQRNSQRLLNLVDQLLDLSKLETGNLNLSVSKGNLTVLLKQLIAAFQFKTKEKNIVFTHQMKTINDAWFDKDVIEKIIINLLSNAVKYTPKNGKIHFEAIVQNGQIIISVINNGNTVPEEELNKLFTRYYQNNKTADGVGIGLSLVKELVTLSHGNIIAHTMNDDEIQFTVTLPIERSFYNSSEIIELQTVENPVIQNSPNTIEPISKTKNNKNKPLLLIVEDDEDIRQFISSIFEQDYTIKKATDGEQGIANALKYIPDIIISDIMMPRISGIELCNTLKLDERTSHIPIILLTAKSGDKNEIIGLKTGADDYITKPFNNNKLKIRVEKLIELRQQLQQRYSNSFNLSDIKTTSVDQQFLKKLKEVLNKNITNTDFNSELLSKNMLMSRMQLHRKLKALTGLTTSEFIKSQRLKASLPLLKASQLTISEIAYSVGFNSVSYFSKCFKDAYNVSPANYIK